MVPGFGSRFTIHIQEFFNGFFIYYHNSYRQSRIEQENPQKGSNSLFCFTIWTGSILLVCSDTQLWKRVPYQGGHKVGEKNSLSFPDFLRAINLL